MTVRLGLRLSLTLSIWLGLSTTALAGTPVSEQVTCALGGERFTHQTTAAYTTFGQRPDGKPYGSWRFPLALPECPKSGLVMYRAFTKDERARLPALLADPVFVDLRRGQTPYYRAAWLEHALQPRSSVTAWLLLNASWEADDESLRKARYQDEFIDAVAVLGPDAAPRERFALQVRAANALRELGRFDAAGAALKAVPRDPLDTDASSPAWTAFLDGLDRAITRSDRTSEPLDMIPAPIAAGYCLGDASVQPRLDPYCRDPKMAEPIQAVRNARGGHAAH